MAPRRQCPAKQTGGCAKTAQIVVEAEQRAPNSDHRLIATDPAAPTDLVVGEIMSAGEEEHRSSERGQRVQSLSIKPFVDIPAGARFPVGMESGAVAVHRLSHGAFAAADGR